MHAVAPSGVASTVLLLVLLSEPPRAVLNPTYCMAYLSVHECSHFNFACTMLPTIFGWHWALFVPCLFVALPLPAVHTKERRR